MYRDKKVVHIVARGLNGEIGANNKLLWSIPEDMLHFRNSTIGQVVLMGRNTVKSLPKPLDRRAVLEVTGYYNRLYGGNMSRDEILYANLNKAVQYCNDILNTKEVLIAGGSQLYNSTFDIVDELWITQVEKEYPEADTFYQIPDGFTLVEDLHGEGCTDVGYSFQKWIRK